MLFDTHCHLNFGAFDGNVAQIVENARQTSVTHIVIPGTDLATSKKAVEIANEFDNIYAAVGIHPHHVFQFQVEHKKIDFNEELKEIEKLLSNPKVVAIGEVGADRHYYQKTKYEAYQIDEQFITLQKEILKKQIQLALQYNKSLILHNREAKKDFLEIVDSSWTSQLENRTVFHCCEPDEELLTYAGKHKIFIGVDGDVTYSEEKKSFVKKIPLGQLVLETDSPFLTPEPLRSSTKGKRPMNTPSNLQVITKFIAGLCDEPIEMVRKTSTANAKRLFQLGEKD